MTIRLSILAGGLLASSILQMPATAQPQTQSIRATITGGGGEGKCTFEVEVDGAADVEIHGDQGTVRNLSGRPARWRRLECNQPMPNNPSDFRFRGVDGRGRQQLVRDPASSGGVAVIRIEDSQGGAEMYTGDLQWRNGNYNWGGVGNWDSGRNPGDNWKTQIAPNEAMNICRNQVMETRGVARNRVTVRRGEVQRDGDSIVNFTFVNNMGRSKSGFCKVARNGQIIQFQIEGGQDRGRSSLNQALDSCQDEVARSLGIERNNVRVQHGLDPGNGSYLINYQAQDRTQRIRTGSCRVSAFGDVEAIRR